MNKIEIIINPSDAQSDSKKTAAFPRRRPHQLGRRRGGAWLEFYDLGQVNTGTVETPIWSDHDILKTPSYTITKFTGAVTYTLDEQFGTADYQAYTQKIFDVGPVSEWSTKFRWLPWEPLPGSPQGDYASANTSYPSNISMLDKNDDYVQPLRTVETDVIGTGFGQMGSDPAFHDVPVHSAEMLAVHGISWKADRLPYQGLDTITATGGSYFPFTSFGGDLPLRQYKITTTNDPDAANVGPIRPSGPTKIFLVPHVGLWAAISTSSDRLTREILGPVFQVQPRKNWPRYLDRTWSQIFDDFVMPGTFVPGAGYVDDPGGRAGTFIVYQSGRSGMQSSSWTLAAPGDSRTTAVMGAGGSFTTNRFYSSIVTRPEGGVPFNGSSSPTRGDTIFTIDDDRLFAMTEPFLSAVIYTRGTYYYVWIELYDDEPSLGAAQFSAALADSYRLHLEYDNDADALLIAGYDDGT